MIPITLLPYGSHYSKHAHLMELSLKGTKSYLIANLHKIMKMKEQFHYLLKISEQMFSIHAEQ